MVLALTVLVILFNIPDCVAIIGNYLYGRDQPRKAEPFFKWSIAHKTKSPSAHLYYATYLLRNGHAAEAEPLLTQAATLNPSVITTKHIRLTQASCQWALRNVDGAIEILEKMRHTYDYVNATVLATLGFMYFVKDDIEKAEELTNKALEDNQSSHAAWDNLGQIRYKQRKYDEAKEAFTKAVSFKGNLPDSLYYLGLIAREEGDENAAADYFKQALECDITPLNTVTREQVEEAARLQPFEVTGD
jgi:tetratricopeptide (TPR) repeat protein